MSRIVELLLSPEFWFATVLIAFVVNLVSGFAKDYVERWWAKYSSHRRAILAERERRIQAEADQLEGSAELQLLLRLDILYLKNRQVLYLILSYMSLLLGLQSALSRNLGGAIFLILFAAIAQLLLNVRITRELARMNSVYRILRSRKGFSVDPLLTG